MSDSRFTFSGPPTLGSQEPFNALLQAVAEEQELEQGRSTPCPQRSQTQTRLYQAEDEELKEREKRAVKSPEKAKAE